jgi:hypothetical protein
MYFARLMPSWGITAYLLAAAAFVAVPSATAQNARACTLTMTQKQKGNSLTVTVTTKDSSAKPRAGVDVYFRLVDSNGNLIAPIQSQKTDAKGQARFDATAALGRTNTTAKSLVPRDGTCGLLQRRMKLN